MPRRNERPSTPPERRQLPARPPRKDHSFPPTAARRELGSAFHRRPTVAIRGWRGDAGFVPLRREGPARRQPASARRPRSGGQRRLADRAAREFEPGPSSGTGRWNGTTTGCGRSSNRPGLTVSSLASWHVDETFALQQHGAVLRDRARREQPPTVRVWAVPVASARIRQQRLTHGPPVSHITPDSTSTPSSGTTIGLAPAAPPRRRCHMNQSSRD